MVANAFTFRKYSKPFHLIDLALRGGDVAEFRWLRALQFLHPGSVHLRRLLARRAEWPENTFQ